MVEKRRSPRRACCAQCDDRPTPPTPAGAGQWQVLALVRSTASYQPTAVSSEDRALMRRLDERHLECLFAGARRLSRMRTREGRPVSRRPGSTRMKRIGGHALYRTLHTSTRHPAHRVLCCAI